MKLRSFLWSVHRRVYSVSSYGLIAVQAHSVEEAREKALKVMRTRKDTSSLRKHVQTIEPMELFCQGDVEFLALRPTDSASKPS